MTVGWVWDEMRRCWEKEESRIYPVDEVFVASVHQVWIDGQWPTFDLAVGACVREKEE
jgi:hypothetical protein